MNIVSMKSADKDAINLFSLHDDYMMDFLGDDKWCYTRYSEKENLENIWIMYSDASPIASIAYRRKDDGVGEVKRLYIVNEHRGRGLSKKLLKTVECYAKEQGCNTLFLDTRITLEPAVSVYRSFGFNIVFQQGLYIQMEKNIVTASN